MTADAENAVAGHRKFRWLATSPNHWARQNRNRCSKVSENPLPSSQGGYGKPLRNANRAHLAGLCKIKFRDLGIRVVYKPVLKEGTMVIIVVGVRTDGEAYLKADERRGRHAL